MCKEYGANKQIDAMHDLCICLLFPMIRLCWIDERNVAKENDINRASSQSKGVFLFLKYENRDISKL